MYLSYQDFIAAKDKGQFINQFIKFHESTEAYKEALKADKYDAQENETILQFQRVYYTLLGQKKIDNFSSNAQICSNFFHKLNTQRCSYSLGNGVFFNDMSVKDKLGKQFDRRIKEAAYNALIHGQSFLFWNVDHVHEFPFTQFAPMWDEDTGALMAGIRFWQLDEQKPFKVVLYEIDGYTTYSAESKFGELKETTPKRAYRQRIETANNLEPEIIGEENYSSLPIVPMFGNKRHISTLRGMQSKIDAYDAVQSGFANDLDDCAQMYWLISNADGMTDDELAEFRDRLKFQHIAKAEEGQVQAYTQEPPYTARKEFLTQMRSEIYEDFGALDVHAIAAGATNDHIDAAYQPLDDNADDFEYFVGDAIEKILKLAGIDDEPQFKRNRISNEKERTDMILEAANYLDEETILKKLPFVAPEEVPDILAKLDEESYNRYTGPIEPDAPENIPEGDE